MKKSTNECANRSVRKPIGTELITFGLFAFVVLAWSLNWVVMKFAVAEVSPLWAVAIRTALATLILFPVLFLLGQLRWPDRADLPVVLSISLFHMTAYTALMTTGLVLIPAGRAIVLGYTTPLWVPPIAYFVLKERLTTRQALGMAAALTGLLILFRPQGLDWSNRPLLVGNGLLLLASIFWSMSIVYTRAHRWKGTPLQLMPWQCLLATLLMVGLAVIFEGPPPLRLSTPAVLAIVYNGVIGTALGYWVMTVVGRRVSASSAALGVLATPVFGIGFSAAILGEQLDASLMIAALFILAGIFIGAAAGKTAED